MWHKKGISEKLNDFCAPIGTWFHGGFVVAAAAHCYYYYYYYYYYDDNAAGIIITANPRGSAKTCVCCPSLPGIASSNPAGVIVVCLL